MTKAEVTETITMLSRVVNEVEMPEAGDEKHLYLVIGILTEIEGSL